MQWKKFFISIGICFAVSLAGSVVTFPAIPTWYAELVKPSFTPPSWVFGPVWTTLYFLMGVSLYLLWSRREKGKKKIAQKTAIELFLLQLFFNFLWSYVFFSQHMLFLSFVVIILLWTSIALVIKHAYQTTKLAAYLLIPYILWVSFAAVLNFSLVLLNH